jgi:hypothetical protein
MNRRSFAPRVEEMERRDTPTATPLPPGFPAPLATSGPADGTVTVFTSAFSTGQFLPTQRGTVIPFPGFAGNVRTTFADVNGDSVQDLVAATGPGTPLRFAVISGTDFTSYLVPPTDPFGDNFTGGGFVAAGDIDHDGRAEVVVTPDLGGGPRVSVFSLLPAGGLQLRANFFGIDDPGFRGGVRPAVGDINGDTFGDLVVAAGPGGGLRIAIYDGRFLFSGSTPTKLVNDFFAFPEAGSDTLRNGTYVAAGDIDSDGLDDLVVGAGAGGGPRVIALSGRLLAGGAVTQAQGGLLASFFLGDPNSRGGVRVAAKLTGGTGTHAEIVAASGDNQPSLVRAYFGALTPGGEPFPSQTIDPYGQVLPGGVFVG